VEDRTPQLRDQVIMLVLSVIGTAAMIWMEIPETQRLWIILSVRMRAQRLAHRAAYRAGHLGMGRELHHDEPSAAVSYSLAYRLSRLRDRL
jgi:hypothetical protein